MKQVVGFIIVLASAAVFSGCGGGGGRDYKIRADQQATITGTVKFRDKNLPLNSLITFFNSEQGIAAVGFADAGGAFTIKAAEKETGLPAGNYAVTVTPPPPPPMTKEQYEKMEANAMAMPNIIYKELPVKFYNSTTSGLAFDVKPGPNHFDLDLSK